MALKPLLKAGCGITLTVSIPTATCSKNTKTDMRLFIDSADIVDIQNCVDTGLIDGVTTNPTLIRKAVGDIYDSVTDIYDELRSMGLTDISMEVSGTKQEMLREALILANRYDDVATIKLPMTRAGLEVCQLLNKEGIRTNVTLIFNAAQALLAAKSGATYVSPFVGRIDDQGYAGLEVVRSIASLFQVTGMRTQVLAASIRTPHRAVRSYFNGAQVVTMPPKVFWQMYNHVLTDAGLAIFEQDIKNTLPDKEPSVW